VASSQFEVLEPDELREVLGCRTRWIPRSPLILPGRVSTVSTRIAVVSLGGSWHLP
jgi:hypothetical protein